MARLSFLEHHTLQPGGQGQAKPLCLRNPDYAKMRKKIEVSFPDQLETAKVKANYIQYHKNADNGAQLYSSGAFRIVGSWSSTKGRYVERPAGKQ